MSVRPGAGPSLLLELDAPPDAAAAARGGGVRQCPDGGPLDRKMKRDGTERDAVLYTGRKIARETMN